MSDRKLLQGQTALVTGSSSGIGAGIVKAMAAAGANVIVNFASSEESANKVVAEIIAAGGPAIEFLEYLSPRNGRPMPLDSRVNDLWHWQVQLMTDSVDRIEQRLRRGKYRFISPGAVILPDEIMGFSKGFLVRDPDGHVILIGKE